ncbi:Aste57867_2211 [Aphanomyces stellatus]|uniref:Aste57867_2211 protein n=1 Tax=Aphanomyces stellatus TaxID=120398 RepID=A0A485KAS4_9STRA|nr:hypothetical protein As57867_002206 [Aphanomyces stellatus]VFT79414.1 Aste57867_2211 [Aphanomyces stellatus]
MMLQRRLLGKVAPLSRNGPAPVLTPGEEMGIVEAVNERTVHAQCFTHDELTSFIRVCIENSQHERMVPDTFPSLTFVKSFIKRHSHDLHFISSFKNGTIIANWTSGSPQTRTCKCGTKTVIQATVRVETRVVVHLREMGIDSTPPVFCASMTQLFKRLPTEPAHPKVADKEAKKKEKEEMLVRKKKASALKRVIAPKTKRALDERRREAAERKLMSLEDSSKPVRRKRPRTHDGVFNFCCVVIRIFQ